jgi:FdhD protein
MTDGARAARRVRITRLVGGERQLARDTLAGEEPLELRVELAGTVRSVVSTMRTPGDDFELAAGWLAAERIITGRHDIAAMRFCTDGADQHYNVLTVSLHRTHRALDALAPRSGIASAACGMCGQAVIDATLGDVAPLDDATRLGHAALYQLPAALRRAQASFSATGGSHAAAWFEADDPAQPRICREDIGRHNAVDKVLGRRLLDGADGRAGVLLVSGRAGYEIVQKCIVARVPILCAISAPSSLAVALARAAGLTLVGFLRDQRANIYSEPHRLV